MVPLHFMTLSLALPYLYKKCHRDDFPCLVCKPCDQIRSIRSHTDATSMFSSLPDNENLNWYKFQ